MFWPDTKEQNIFFSGVNSEIKLKYEDAHETQKDRINKSKQLITNVSDISGIDFEHEENDYVDFSIEPLIPFFLSTQGPKLAVGDINGDGLDDFFIGGSKQQPGKVFLGNKPGDKFFSEGNNTVFEGHRYFEDIGASLVDVDNDNDLDLYVASGGGESGSSELLLDRLYYNDGKGNFNYVSDALPELKNNSSCVVPLDINTDGFIDFFVGGRSIPGKYGLAGISRLLVNNKSGGFIDETIRYFENDGRIGMVTDAAWIAQKNELVIVGEWMPIKIYSIKSNKVSSLEIPNSSGWWNSLHATDLDDDGDIDFLVGNVGLNIDLSASVEHPIDLFVKDFDGNLTLEPILAYYKNGKRWAYPGLDELSIQMPALRQVFPIYHLFANKTFDELFPSTLLKGSIHSQTQILTSVIVENSNQGYQLKELPLLSQVSPIFGFAVNDFDGDGINDILAIGNLYDCQPSIGTLDASYGTFLKGRNNLDFEYIEPIKSGFALQGEARDIKLVTGADEKRLILISRNNNSACLLK